MRNTLFLFVITMSFIFVYPQGRQGGEGFDGGIVRFLKSAKLHNCSLMLIITVLLFLRKIEERDLSLPMWH